MQTTFIDIENTIDKRVYTKRNGETENVTDNSPYNASNMLVSVGLCSRSTDPTKPKEFVRYFGINHENFLAADVAQNIRTIQEVLDNTDLLVAHNMKYDLSWLRAAGFRYDGNIYDTMVAEYISQCGIKSTLSLAGLAEKYDLTRKKVDIKFDWENLHRHDWDELTEYGIADVQALMELYDHQQNRMDPQLNPTIHMSMDFLDCLIDMEKNGAYIDTDALKELEVEYTKEARELERDLHSMARDVMGDTPIRLTSPDFRSELLYSRRVLDKQMWKRVFHIGLDKSGKKKYRPPMSESAFRKHVRANTEIVRRTHAEHCKACYGKGLVRKTKKDGTPFKNESKCSVCDGEGVVYTPTGKVAGFRLIPRGVGDVSAAGFVSDAATLEILTVNASGDAKVFLQKWSRLNAVQTYLDTFVGGIWKHIGSDNILRTNFNQTVTATGRLSSTAPNLHNQPRGGTFPVRKVFRSRFKDGKIIKSDYSTLEYRTAGYLAGCSVVLNAVRTKEDAHAYTRDTINSHSDTKAGKEGEIDRQAAKSHTFKPLYGGRSGTPREKHYYEAFMEKHKGISAWHEELLSSALSTHGVSTPSGRRYAFPQARRTKTGYVFGTTQIVNYPVQGFATADLVPIGIIYTWQRFKEENFRSLLFLTVHDEIVVDWHPEDDLDSVINAITEGMLYGLVEGCAHYYDLDLKWPFGCEVNLGDNWLEAKEVCAAELNDDMVIERTYADDYIIGMWREAV